MFNMDYNSELEKFKRRLIRAVARMLLHEKRNEDEVWEGLKKETGCDCKELWQRMHALTLKKLNRLLEVEDRVHLLPRAARMSITDWLLFDYVLVHEDYNIIGMNELTRNDRQVLVDLFELVEEFKIEFLAGDQLADAWSRLTQTYNKDDRQCSPMLLQRRWYQLKQVTRARFYKFWFMYRGTAKKLVQAQPYRPTNLQTRIAKTYKPLVVSPFMFWEDLVKNKLVILPDEFEPKDCHKKSVDEHTPEVMCLETDVETIDLDQDSDTELEYRKPITEKEEDVPPVKIKTEPKEEEDSFDESAVPYESRQEKISHFANAVMEATTLQLNEIELVDNIIHEYDNEDDNKGSPNDAQNVLNNDNVTNIDDDGVIPVEEPQEEEEVPSNHAIKENVTINEDDDVIPVVEDLNENDMKLTEVKSEIQAIDNDVHIEENNEVTNAQEIVLPLITHVFSGADVSNETLSKIGLLGAHDETIVEHDAVEQSKDDPIVLSSDSKDDDPCIEIGRNDGEVNDDANFDIKSEVVEKSDVDMEPDINSLCFGELSNDIVFADDGIQLLDDGIAFHDDDNKTEDEIITETDNEEALSAESENTPAVDQKLLLLPVVPTVKLDDMGILPIELLKHVNNKTIIDIIDFKSKPVKKEISNYSSEPIDEEVKQDIKKVKLSSALLQKPRSRTYNPIQLCKNPDFNTRLKRLPVGFFSSPRNIMLLKACNPLTIDVSKAFESRLVEGTMYLKPSEDNDLPEVMSVDESSRVSIAPSAMPVQSLIDNTNVELSQVASPPTVPKPKDTSVASARNTVINLPDISEIRRINQRLLTAQVTPLQLKNGSAQLPVSIIPDTDASKNIDLTSPPRRYVAGPASRTKSISTSVVDITKDTTTRTPSTESQAVNTPKPRENLKTGCRIIPWKPRETRPEIPWYAKNAKSYDENTLLALDTLNKILFLLTEEGNESVVDKPRNKKKKIAALRLAATQLSVTNPDVANGDVVKPAAANGDVVKLAAENADVAKSTAANADVVKSTAANADVVKSAEANADVVKSAAANGDVAKPAAANADVVKSAAGNADVAKSAAGNADVTKSAEANVDVVKPAAANADVVKSAAGNADLVKPTAASTETIVIDEDVQVVSETKPRNKKGPFRRSVKSKSPRASTENINSTSCCWARERISQMAGSMKPLSKHNCAFPLCMCCCKLALADYFQMRKNVTSVQNNFQTISNDKIGDKAKTADAAEIIPIVKITAGRDKYNDKFKNFNKTTRDRRLSSQIEVGNDNSREDNNKDGPMNMLSQVDNDTLGAEVSIETSEPTKMPHIHVKFNSKSYRQERVRVTAGDRSYVVIDPKKQNKPTELKYKVGTGPIKVNKTTEGRVMRTLTIDPLPKLSPIPVNQRLLYMNSTKIPEAPSDNPIYLGKNKILLTTAKFPPNYKAFEALQRNLKQTLALPKDIQLVLEPNGRLTYTQDPNVVPNHTFMATMPQLIEAFQNHIDGVPVVPSTEQNKSVHNHFPNEIINLSDDESPECNASNERSTGSKDMTEQQKTTSPAMESTGQSPLKCIQGGNVDKTQNDEKTQLQSINETQNDNANKNHHIAVDKNQNDNLKEALSDSLNESPNDNENATQDKKLNENQNDDINEIQADNIIKTQNDSLIVTQEEPALAGGVNESYKVEDSINRDEKETDETPNSEKTTEETKTDNEVIDSNENSNDKPKNILSDLMAMSGIGPVDVSPTTVQEITQNVPSTSAFESASTVSPVAPANDQNPTNSVVVTTNHTQTPTNNLLLQALTAITSLSELKYACSQNGSFFKLDLNTRLLVPINVCMKKMSEAARVQAELQKKTEFIPTTERTLIADSADKPVIDLTDDDGCRDTDANAPIIVQKQSQNTPHNNKDGQAPQGANSKGVNTSTPTQTYPKAWKPGLTTLQKKLQKIQKKIIKAKKEQDKIRRQLKRKQEMESGVHKDVIVVGDDNSSAQSDQRDKNTGQVLKNVAGDRKTASSVKPIKLFKLTSNGPSILNKKLELVERQIENSLTTQDKIYRQLKRKQDLSALREDNITEVHKSHSSDCSSDEEPLSHVAKRIRVVRSEDLKSNASIETNAGDIQEDIPMNVVTNPEETVASTVDKRVDEQTLTKPADDMVMEYLEEDLSENTEDEDCILGV